MIGLHVDSVMKSFGTKQVLTDVYLSCRKGEVVGLLGRNGSGKSTLLKIIFGSLTADRKFVTVDGKIPQGWFGNGKLLKYLPQDGLLPDNLKIRIAINMLCDKQQAKLLLQHPCILPHMDKCCKHLSGGEKRLIEVLVLIHSEAKFVMIDEPFNGISPIYKDEIKRLILEQSENKGFIVTDHDYRNILDVATRVVLIFDGGTKEMKNKGELVKWGYLPVNAWHDMAEAR